MATDPARRYAPHDLDRIKADAVFWLGQLFPQDVSVVAGDFFDYVLASLRSLPVEQRMEAMGMQRVTYGYGLGIGDEVLYREPGTGRDR